MKAVRLLTLIALVSLVMLGQVYAQVLFFADFEPNSKDAKPNAAVNNVANWKPENPAEIWAIADFKGSGKGLRQTVEGCATSGNTPLPGVTNFTDGIIQLEMSFGDDDSWGVFFRQSAKDKGYFVTFGYVETPAVIVALLDKGCGVMGKCNDEAGCENNAANTLAQVPHGLDGVIGGKLDNTVVLFGRIEARGDTIKVWYLPRAQVKDPFANSAAFGKPLVEIKNGTHKSGSVGIWHESCNNCTIDNVLVGGGGFSVDAKDKLATSWGAIKNAY